MNYNYYLFIAVLCVSVLARCLFCGSLCSKTLLSGKNLVLCE